MVCKCWFASSTFHILEMRRLKMHNAWQVWCNRFKYLFLVFPVFLIPPSNPFPTECRLTSYSATFIRILGCWLLRILNKNLCIDYIINTKNVYLLPLSYLTYEASLVQSWATHGVAFCMRRVRLKVSEILRKYICCTGAVSVWIKWIKASV